ncbi:hypothetical protein [Legionella londiniensis]|uniref:Uncharacterized protein n=1 Tax=Legionella londiniensis TaxID=45068 RepID=A0A0W0VN10_9GAMM|nr:hypothetical protein [Legionella londiniensis]KTD21309.1 hypothetical protein Llon_1407 [Legionella londiniensis]STX93335.1 Uncharacterised protein [Legionella londiniensis]
MTLFASSKDKDLKFSDVKIITGKFGATIENLAKFSNLADQNLSQEIIAILSELNKINQLDPGTIQEEIIENLRARFNKLLSQNNLKQGHSSLSDVAFEALIDLAKFKPINKNDPISCDEIEEEDKIFVSTGHQFSLKNLIEYHNTRAYRGNPLGERYDSKWLLNPLTNDKFHPKDAVHIKTLADKKGIAIEHLRTQGEENSHLSNYGFFGSHGIPRANLINPIDYSHQESFPTIDFAALARLELAIEQLRGQMSAFNGNDDSLEDGLEDQSLPLPVIESATHLRNLGMTAQQARVQLLGFDGNDDSHEDEQEEPSFSLQQ